ncbi:HNH endonuclease signature motif containing protein [Methylobacterium sp. UNCCL125]|uniref:HNH endonuclease n=1 Tax=Methylobacterium sp. UNCCL125 TaxID=1502759 RepID=UPI0008EF2372|nr:HNH endonuclease signature motif containing protein [Methylobacterium sp. UNCCL125]SFU37475.1 HNH endonuclease [Methylobacterium sp. UNCCL125]
MAIRSEALRALVAAGASAEMLLVVIEADEKAGDLVVLDGRHISPELRAEVIARDGPVCRYCQRVTAYPQLDHVLPWSRGGATDAANLVVSCKSCNTAKKDRTPEEWRGA